jgi:hypothetical protein
VLLGKDSKARSARSPLLFLTAPLSRLASRLGQPLSLIIVVSPKDGLPKPAGKNDFPPTPTTKKIRLAHPTHYKKVPISNTSRKVSGPCKSLLCPWTLAKDPRPIIGLRSRQTLLNPTTLPLQAKGGVKITKLNLVHPPGGIRLHEDRQLPAPLGHHHHHYGHHHLLSHARPPPRAPVPYVDSSRMHRTVR